MQSTHTHKKMFELKERKKNPEVHVDHYLMTRRNKKRDTITLPNSSKSYNQNIFNVRKWRKKKLKSRETRHYQFLSSMFSFTLGIIRNLGVWLSWLAGSIIVDRVQRTRNKEELSFFSLVGRRTYLYEFNIIWIISKI